MSKISVTTLDKKLIFDKVNHIENNVNLNNTNVIDVENMYFSEIYIKQNMYTMMSFLNLIAANKNIKHMLIKNISIAPLVLKLTRDISIINKLTISDNVNVDYETFEALSLSDHLETVECFSMPPFMFDRLDQEFNKRIKLRQKEMFYSPFMKSNKLETYNEIFYCKKIVINEKPSSQDLEDIASFFRVNTRIRMIELEYYDYRLLTNILSYLNQNNSKNVLIVLRHRENENIISLLGKIDKSYARFFKNNNIKVKVRYQKENKNKYFLKQLNLNLIRLIFIIIILIILILLATFKYKEYADTKASKEINEDNLNSFRDELSDLQDAIDKERAAQDAILAAEEEGLELNRDPSYDIYFQKIDKLWANLLKINPETVGWLTVPSTKIDYPIVQAKDNIYYLNRNFNRVRNIYGWVYMDYRNNINKADQNTIIYAHRTSNGLMFGSLSNVLNPSWFEKTENHYISFNTPLENNFWQIFSVYTIRETNDYLYTNFENDAQRMEFFTKLENRSIYDFGVNVSPLDQILTLSTCFENSSKRLVVHAKKLK